MNKLIKIIFVFVAIASVLDEAGDQGGGGPESEYLGLHEGWEVLPVLLHLVLQQPGSRLVLDTLHVLIHILIERLSRVTHSLDALVHYLLVLEHTRRHDPVLHRRDARHVFLRLIQAFQCLQVLLRLLVLSCLLSFHVVFRNRVQERSHLLVVVRLVDLLQTSRVEAHSNSRVPVVLQVFLGFDGLIVKSGDVVFHMVLLKIGVVEGQGLEYRRRGTV